MIRNIWILIAKKLNGEATAEELQELEHLLRQQDTDISINALENLWQKTSEPAPNVTGELDQKWEQFNARLDIIDATENNEAEIAETVSPKRGFLKTLLIYASSCAAVLALVLVTIHLTKTQVKQNQGITSIVAPASGVSKIILPDGSNVWLNSGSKITYNNNPQTQCREVTLLGEAYFDVVKDAAHPFTVETPTFKIKVLGTAFNVRSYKNDIKAEATLVRGRIELTVLKSPEKKYILSPSERFKINNIPEPVIKNDIKIESIPKFSSIELSEVQAHTIEGVPSETLWMRNVINFDGTNFEEIALMMEHKYNVSFVFKNDEAKKLKFTGKFRNETIELAMRELKATADFHYKITENQITIY